MDLLLVAGIFAAGIRLGMAIGLSAIGESASERAGVFNIGIEGIMLSAAFVAAWGSVRTGSPWRDLPEAFGEWNSVFRRFSRWSRKNVWRRIFEAMSDDPDFEYLIVDSTIVRAHQHAAGAKKGGLKIRRSAARAAA